MLQPGLNGYFKKKETRTKGITVMKKSTILCILVLMVFSLQVEAQSADKKWGIGLFTGSEQYNGDLGNGFYSFGQPFYGFGGLSVSRYLNPHLDLVASATYGEIGHTEVESSNRFRANMFSLSAQLRYNFFQSDAVSFRPYVFAGLGYMNFADLDLDRNVNDAMLPNLGAGIRYKITPDINIFFQETFIYSGSDNVDYEARNSNDSYMQHAIGLVYVFGKSKDTDGDGIADGKDKCPETPGLESMQGCPDTDGDGITDKEDACPQQKGLDQFNGCPDSDEDGIADKDDACPNEAGAKEFNGCPDSDKDGIADKDDQCPQIAGLEELQGCPDTDGDGIADKDDTCPKEAGSAALNGCPDKDGDKVADKDDVCPEVAGIAANKGCPEVKEEEVEILEEALHGIKFESGKDVIKQSSNPILENVLGIMERNNAYHLKIEGHTDSQGNDDMNLELSKKRAKAVLDYLVSNGIDASRLSSTGFGETRPVADNGTAAGRADNRRVELTIEF